MKTYIMETQGKNGQIWVDTLSAKSLRDAVNHANLLCRTEGYKLITVRREW